MSRLTNEQRYPSIDEFDGWYNLGYVRDDEPGLQSRKRIPPFMHGDFYQFYIAEHRWFDELVRESERLPYDPLAEPPFYLVSEADDRTFTVNANCDYVTVDRLRRIQKEFLGRYPLWRVYLTLEDRSNSIMIYPEAIRYGNFPLDCDPEEALQALVRRARVLRKEQLRPRRAELSFLEKRLPGAVRAIGDRPFLVLGVFDNVFDYYEVERGWLSIFLLVRGADTNAVDLDGPPGTDNDFLAHGGGDRGVNAEGRIFGEGVSESAPFHIRKWLFPADFRGALTIIERATGKRHAFEVKSEEIVRADLQE